MVSRTVRNTADRGGIRSKVPLGAWKVLTEIRLGFYVYSAGRAELASLSRVRHGPAGAGGQPEGHRPPGMARSVADHQIEAEHGGEVEPLAVFQLAHVRGLRESCVADHRRQLRADPGERVRHHVPVVRVDVRGD